MKKLRNIFLFLALVLTAPIGYAIWPTVDVVTTNLDSDTDSLTAARADLNDLAIKFNQVIGHVSTFMRTVLDDADATAARATLGAAASSGGTISGATLSGTTINSGTISGGTYATPTLTGTTLTNGPITSTKACASGHTRVSPNFCHKDSANSLTFTQTANSTCAQATAISGVSDATAVMFRVEMAVVSLNSVGLRQAVQNVYGPTDSACTGAATSNFLTVHEAVAVGPATTLLVSRTDTSGRTYIKNISNSNGGGTVSFYPMGYYD
jgi:hypothetical protein